MGFLGDEPRARLIKAAAELCTERGFEEIEEEELAARAGLSSATLRELFPDGTEECLAEAQNAIMIEVVAAIGRSYSADRSEIESVIRGSKAVLELMAENPEFAYLGYVFSRQMAPGRVKKVNESGHQMLEAMLERGWEYSPSPHQPAHVALAILGGAQALVRKEVVAGRADRLPQLLPDCVYLATVPFLGQRQALRLMKQAATLLASESTTTIVFP